MGNYVARKNEIEAVKLCDAIPAIAGVPTDDMPDWVFEAVKDDMIVALHVPQRLQLVTGNGRVEGRPEDYLARSPDGDLSIVDGATFERQYEPA